MASEGGDTAAEQAASGQSKRPVFTHHDSETSQASDHTRDSGTSRDHQHHHHRPKHQKHVVGGANRMHARVPSSKALHKHHGASTSKVNVRRHMSPSPERKATTSGHRRVQSEAKLSRDSSSSNLRSNTSSASLRRNKSHVEVHKRTKSSDKLKRTASNPAVNKVKAAKSTVHFDLGTDGAEDEWVDASGSASPYLSRRGSMASGQSSAKPGNNSVTDSQPHTPKDHPSPPSPPLPDRETAQHKEYITSRLLQRTPSHGAPPQMTHDTVSVSRNRSTESLAQSTMSTDGINPSAKASAGSSGRDELTSRFVGASSSGGRNESFYHPNTSSRRGARQSQEESRPQSADASAQDDASALAPRSRRRAAAPPAGQSRVQQKLNLQRASSVIEPNQAVGGGMGMAMGLGGGTIGATPLVGVAGPGYDGAASMEYLSVRRYQNPVARSLERVLQLQEANRPQRIPAGRNGTIPGLGGGKFASRPGLGHTRNRPVTPRAHTGAGSSTNGLSGSSLVGGEDEVPDAGLNALASQD
ncbi:hypothetical protein F5X68DRAFT_212115 [Plectosphaerella plurivora]|uniref:Uncharacterized protein n=1 Tax=Plectosphaerella plurivora TaxID=936078 RepID=A0A9P8V7B6_9PEZI|nr:hypothetical protein F5X68DRAFT_212115 [Plectosphaerella plurivora]